MAMRSFHLRVEGTVISASLSWEAATFSFAPVLAPPLRSADYTVASVSEWNTVFANSAATLANTIVEVTAPLTDAVAITNKDFTAAGGPVTIRTAGTGAIAHLDLNTLVRGVTFSGARFQMVGWPRAFGECVQFNTGTFGGLRFINGTSFRHGYGPSLVDFDTSIELPEYERVDHVQTATTTSATYELDWQDPAATTGLIEFFNRGAQTVYVAFGGSGVTASASDTECPPGQRTRIAGLDPTTDTHFAIIAASGTSEINARAEIGLGYYLADAFASSGAAVLEDVEIIGCTFRDLFNGAKGILRPESVVCMDCDFDRIYSDVAALPPGAGGSARFLRNTISVQFARSGIPETENGDAGDPHGDVFQMFGNGADTITDVIIAGNRMRAGSLRAGVTNQGLFISDNDVLPSYADLYIISNTLIGGSPTQLGFGEPPNYEARDVLIYGATIVDYSNVDNVSPRVSTGTDQGGSVYLGSVISPSFLTIAGGEEPMRDNTLQLTLAADPASVFPDLDDIFTATNRAQIEAALTTAAEGAGIGAVATANAINWSTSDPEAVVRWENVPSGAHWNALGQQDASTLITLPLRKILNPRTGQTVSVGAGTEWRSVDTDGTTEAQAWTGSAGTIEPGQFIQIRATSSGTGGGTVTASVTINGFTQSVPITTAIVPTAYLIQPASAAYFVDSATTPAATNRITFRGFFWFPATGWTSCRPFTQQSTGCDLTVAPNGSALVTVEDGTGTKMLTNESIAVVGTIPMEQWVELVFDVDQVAEAATLSVDGTDYVLPFDVASNGVFQTIDVAFLATTTGTNRVPELTRTADLSVDFNGVRYKTVPNDATSANADAWKAGAGLFTSVP